MIRQENKCFILDTMKTTYCFRVTDTGHLEHLYYGRKITINDERTINALTEKQEFIPGNLNAYDDDNKQFSLEDVCLEVSSYGKGDVREPFIEVIHADGSSTSDFLFEKAEIIDGKRKSIILPTSYDDENKVKQLCITLKDEQYGLILELYYAVFESCDVIARSARFVNSSNENVKLNRLMSMQIDFHEADFVLSTFNGAWAREMKRNDMHIRAGKYINSSYTGTSSNRANPFIMLSKEETSEDIGECFGFNLVYSGNHYEAAEVNCFGKTRLVTGINPTGFSFVIEPENDFESPEAIMTFSKDGFNGMSHNMHEFVREHIVRGTWKKKVRPILMNSWEACYFDINERKLLNLAKEGRDVGVELFVMDDGWFGERNDDTSSLGDWDVNKKKLPNGVAGLADKIKKLGMDFGIWVEPEMVSVNSKLYREHPDWVIEIKGKPHSEGRNQRLLDLSRAEVQDFIIEKMSEVFSSADISYVKWDMNRTFTDYYSSNLPADRQGEVAHRYVLGLYRCMKELTARFPEILFEGCSAGGNRFDLGILSYFPQIWASDDTDALCRSDIQNGYSYGYPMSTVTAHVSGCPNHQTLRDTPLETRFNTACFGVFGYECNFSDMKKEELSQVKEQIELYKEWREILQFGTFYRGRNPYIKSVTNGFDTSLQDNGANCMEWTCVSRDKEKAVGYIMQRLVVPNTRFQYYRAKGLLEEKEYHFYNRNLKYNIKEFGDLVNTVAPIHIKQDSIVHNVLARIIKMDGETENIYAYGDTLMYAGVKLKQGFAGTGYNEKVRYYQDFGSRLYFME